MASGGSPQDAGSAVNATRSAEFSISYDNASPPQVVVEKPESPKLAAGRQFLSLKQLMYEYNINNLKTFINQNYHAMKLGHFIKDQLIQLLKKFAPASSSYPPDIDPLLLIKILDDFMEDQQRKLTLFDISIEGSGLLEGSALAARINSSMKKISELVATLQLRQNEADQNVGILQGLLNENLELIRAYESKIQFLSDKILNMQEKQLGETGLSEKEFVVELRQHLETDLHLNSTFRQQLVEEQQAKQDLLQEVMNLKEQSIYDEAEKIKEIAELAKDLELDEGVRRLIIERIQTLTANPQEIEMAVNGWMNAVLSTIEPKLDQIDDLKDEIKHMDDEIASLKLQHQEVAENYNRLMTDLNEEVDGKVEELELKEGELAMLRQALDSQAQPGYSLPTIYYDTTSTMQPVSSSPLSSTPIVNAPLRSRIGTPVSALTPHSPPQIIGEILPFSGTSSSFSDSSKRSPSPLNLRSPSPVIQVYGESNASALAPGTVTIPQTSSVFSSEIPPMSPSAKNISQVTNRIHVGKSFQMRTIQQGLLSPYKQETRVESIIPNTEESNRFADTPLNVTHRAEFTPTQFVTPFISKSRFGYTDPTAKVLNLPPGDDLDIPTKFKKAVLLTSPKRTEPLRADIVVHPKALTRTSSGENLACDITIGLQEQPDISSVTTYGYPPAVTPTSTRRYGLFTPKGIFQKKHFNVRKVYRPEEYYSPNLPWSPQFLPQDARSPVGPLMPSPELMDKSISWEKGSGPLVPSVMNTTFEAAPAMNRTFDAATHPVINRTFEAAPAMNRTFDTSPPPVMNRTFDAYSPPVMNRTFGASSPRLLNTTFEQLRPSERSRSPARNQTFNASHSPPLHTTFDKSPSPPLHVTFEKSQSSPINRTFDTEKPSTSNRILNRILPPSPEEISDRTTSSMYDESDFDSSLYEQNVSTQSLGTYDLGYSPHVEGISRRRQPPQFHITF